MMEWLAAPMGLALGSAAVIVAAWLPVGQGWRSDADVGTDLATFLRAPRFAGQRPSAQAVGGAAAGLGAVLQGLWWLAPDPGTWAPLSLFLAALLALAIGDLRDRWLPDMITGPLTWCGLLWSPVVDPYDRIVGAVVAFATLWLSNAVGRWRAGRDTIGSGDIWMAGALGAWLGPTMGVTTVLVALVLMLLVRPMLKNEYGPLGVPMAVAGAAAAVAAGTPVSLVLQG